MNSRANDSQSPLRFRTAPVLRPLLHCPMKSGPAMLKYVRIAVTVLSLTACVLLIVLWVRSYFVWHSPHGPVLGTWTVQINSLKGYLFIGVDNVTARRDYPWNWRTF